MGGVLEAMSERDMSVLSIFVINKSLLTYIKMQWPE